MDNSVVVRLMVRDDGSVQLKRFQGQIAATKAEAESLGRSGMSVGTIFDALDGKVGNLSSQMSSWNRTMVSASSTLRHDLLYAVRDVTLGLTAAAGAATYFGLKAVDSFQHTQAAFSVLTGSVANGHKLYNQLMALNLKSPFDMQPLASSAQTLLGFGFTGQNVTPLLRNLSNVAAVQQDPNEALMRIALAVGQINQSGVVRAQDLNQLVQAGLPAYSLIPGGHQGLLNSGHPMSSQQFIGQLMNPSNPSLSRYGNAAAQMNQTLSGQWSNLTTEVRQSAIKAFMPMAHELIGDMPALTKTLRGATRELAPDVATFGMDIIKGAEHILPVLLPIVHSLTQGMDKLLSAGGPFLTQMGNVDPKITAALDDLFTTLAAEEPEIAKLFGDLLDTLPAAIHLLGDLVPLVDPILQVVDGLLQFGPAKDAVAGLLIALLAYKTLDGPVGAILGFSRALRGLAGAERSVAEANIVAAETSGETGAIGGFGKGGRFGRGALGALMLAPGVMDAIHGHTSKSDYFTNLLGGATTGSAFGPEGALIGAAAGGGFDLGTALQHRYGHHDAPDPGGFFMQNHAQQLRAVNDPIVERALNRAHATFNMQTGAITIHAAPGMDEEKLAQKVQDALDNWLWQQQNRK